MGSGYVAFGVQYLCSGRFVTAKRTFKVIVKFIKQAFKMFENGKQLRLAFT